MRILFLGLNYPPEEIGIAVYSAGLCEELAARGHEVRAIAAHPYYPQWKVFAGHGGWWKQTREGGVRLTRCPIYVPANPTGARRILHHVSFLLSAFLPMMRTATEFRPDVVMTVAPSLIASPLAWLAAKIAAAKSWLHVQDFEVESAFATGLLDGTSTGAKLARRLERRAIGAFDRVSSISPEMCAKLVEMGLEPEIVSEFRNWAQNDEIRSLDRPSTYRAEWQIATPHVALYSGNIANKQGIEILVEVARRLQFRQDLTFVICGQGPNRRNLEALAKGAPNIVFHDLQPPERLNELLGLATIHLLPQKANAADLVLPSKLTNMLASGRPVVATAHRGTGLARELATGGIVVPPEDPGAMTDAIVRLLDDPALHRELSTQAALRAAEVWNKRRIIDGLASKLVGLTVR